jgi:hypothetical protein
MKTKYVKFANTEIGKCLKKQDLSGFGLQTSTPAPSLAMLIKI